MCKRKQQVNGKVQGVKLSEQENVLEKKVKNRRKTREQKGTSAEGGKDKVKQRLSPWSVLLKREKAVKILH